MATLVPQSMNRTPGLVATFAAVTAGGDECPNDGRTFLEIKGGASAGTCTIASQVPASAAPVGTAPANVVVTVPQTPGVVLAGPFPTGPYNNAANRLVLTYTNPTGMTIAAVKMGL